MNPAASSACVAWSCVLPVTSGMVTAPGAAFPSETVTSTVAPLLVYVPGGGVWAVMLPRPYVAVGLVGFDDEARRLQDLGGNGLDITHDGGYRDYGPRTLLFTAMVTIVPRGLRVPAGGV